MCLVHRKATFHTGSVEIFTEISFRDNFFGRKEAVGECLPRIEATIMVTSIAVWDQPVRRKLFHESIALASCVQQLARDALLQAHEPRKDKSPSINDARSRGHRVVASWPVTRRCGSQVVFHRSRLVRTQQAASCLIATHLTLRSVDLHVWQPMSLTSESTPH